LGRVLGKRALVYIGILVFAFALLLILNSGTASAAGPTYWDSDITEDTNWTEDLSPIIVTADIEILPDATLTIESNVTVMFDADVNLTVSGGLVAVGTADEPITFTANDSTELGFWEGILVNHTEDVTLEHVLILYANTALGIEDGGASLNAVEVGYAGEIGIGYRQTSGNLTVDLSNVNVNHTGEDVLVGIGFEVLDGDLHLSMSDVRLNDTWPGGIGASVNGSITASITNVSVSEALYFGIGLEAEGDVTAALTNVTIDNVWDGGGIFIDAAGTATLELTGVTIESTGWSPIALHANESVEITILESTLNDTGEGFSIESDTGDITVTVEASSFMNIDGPALDMTAWSSEIVITVVDSYFYNTAVGVTATTTGDITALIDNTVMEEIGDVGVMLYSTNGNIDAQITSSQIGGDEVPGSIGVYLWTPNGDVGILIDASEIMLWDNGLQVDALEPIVSMEAAVVDSCVTGVVIYADGNATVSIANSTCVDNVDNAIWVESNLGDVLLDIMSGYVNGTTGMGVFAQSYDGDVIVSLEGVTFSQNMFSVYLETMIGDVNLVIDGCWFLGDDIISVAVEAAGEADVEVVDTVMNGEISDAGGWYYVDEVEYEYEIIWPAGNWTTGSWMSVPLPFDFPFYGHAYDTAYISACGIISFDSPVTSPANFGTYDQPMIVPIQDFFYADRQPYYGYKVYDDKVIIQWDVYRDNPSLRNVFQVVLYDNGDIQFNYDELEAFTHSTYSYGLSFGMYGYIDLRYAWNDDAFENDLSSVYFTCTPMTEVGAVYVEAEEDITFCMNNSTVSHYGDMGVMLHSLNGWIDLEVSDNTFEYLLGANGALTAIAENGTIAADIAENDFSRIVELGILLLSMPSMGGEESISIANNTFHEGGVISIAVATEISDLESEDALEFASTRSIVNNVGVNTGGMLMATGIEAEDAEWSVSINETVTNNLFEGIPPYYGFAPTEVPLQPMGLGSLTSYFYGEFNEFNATVVRNVEITNNVLEPSVIDGNGIVVYDELDVDNAIVDYAASVIIADNTLQAVENEFDTALMTGFDGYLGDGGLSMVIDVTIEDNILVSEAEDGYDGIEFWSYLWAGYGEGDTSLDIVLSIENNLVDGFDDAVNVDVETYAYNQWTDMTVNTDISIVGNEIVNSGNGIDVNIYTEMSFWNYFPPYEEEVTSTAVAVFDIDVSGNTVNVSNVGIEIDLEAYAEEDWYGVFNNAVVEVDYDVSVADNVIITRNEGIFVGAYISANSGECQVTRNLNVGITGNEVSGGYWGIGVYEGADARVAQLDFADSPVATSEASIIIDGNIISDTDYGIWTYVEAYAAYGQSMASAVSEYQITRNVINACSYEGIGSWVEYWTNQYSDYTSAEVNASLNVLIGDNLVTDIGLASDDLSAGLGVEAGAWTGSGVSGEIVFDILGNTLVGTEELAEVGVYVYDGAGDSESIAMFNIIDNVIQNADYGIVVEDASVLISGNEISNIDDTGIYLYGATGEVTDNLVTECYQGIVLDDCWDSVVSGNELVTTWGDDTDDGIEVSYCYNCTIKDNTIDGFDYGMYIYSSEEIYVLSNEITNSLWDGVLLSDSDYVEIVDNEIVGSQGYGIEADDCSYMLIEGNLVSDHLYTGIYVSETDMATIANNTVMGNGEEGLYMYGCDGTVLYNGVFVDNYYDGIYVSSGGNKWIVDSEAEVRNNPVSFYGDIIVADGGVLTLDLVKNFYLTGDSYDGIGELRVDEGGKLVASNTDFRGYHNGALNGGGYLFNVWGELMMDNCGVSDAKELYLGPTSSATIHSSEIWYNAWNGINVDNSSPVIASSTIQGNDKSGIFIHGADAAPVIKDCLIVDNERGIYAYQTALGKIVDNVFVGNSYAGIYGEEVTGSIHDNIFLMNQNAIYLKSSTVTVEDNQIGYSVLMDLMVEYMPLFLLYYEDGYLPPEMILELMGNEKGIYAVDSTVECSANVYGMLRYAVYVVDCELTFADSVEKKTLIIPYFDDTGMLRNISLPVFVYDGIFASGSEVMVQGAYIEVLDDAVFLENCTAEISGSELVAGDFDVYATEGSDCTVMNTSYTKVKAGNPSTVRVVYAVTVIALDSDGNPVAGVAVLITNASGEIVAEGVTGSDGRFVAPLVGVEYTMDGVSTDMNPYTVNVTFEDGEVTQTFTVDKPIEVMVEVPSPEPWDTSPAIVITVVAALLVGLGLLVIARP